MSAVSFSEVKIESKIDVKEYNDIYSALIIDPKAIRENLLSKETPEILSKISENIVEIGPRPDRIVAKLNSRVTIKGELLNKINNKIKEITDFIKKHNIRATQFQAAFPDLILSHRYQIYKQKGNLQRFVSDFTLPLIYQFPGSGPVIPEKYRNQEHYGEFNIALTKALSQGSQSVNWTIVEKSLEWIIPVEFIDEEELQEEIAKKSEKKEEKKSKVDKTTTKKQRSGNL